MIQLSALENHEDWRVREAVATIRQQAEEIALWKERTETAERHLLAAEASERAKQKYIEKQVEEIAKLRQSITLGVIEKTAQFAAHRVCCGTEHDPLNGKLHGYCVVCGVPWPCEFAKSQTGE